MSLTVEAFRTNFATQLDTLLGPKARKSDDGVREKTVVMGILDRALKAYTRLSTRDFAPIQSAFKRILETAQTKDTDEAPSTTKRNYQKATDVPEAPVSTISSRMVGLAKEAFAKTRPKP